MTKVTLLFLIALAFETAVRASSTGAHGGGDNKSRPDHYAWFVGSEQGKEVTYCVSVGAKIADQRQLIPNVDLVLQRIQRSVETSFAAWKKYRYQRPPQENAWAVNLSARYVGHCHKTTADLKILMGALPLDELFGPIEERRKEFQNPAAFSYLQKYDFEKGWGKGVIWLHDGMPFRYRAADGESVDLYWDREGAIETLLMHEIGHVLGNGHVSGTIMDEDILGRLVRVQTKQLTSSNEDVPAIDGSQQLLPLATIEASQNNEGIRVKMLSPFEFSKRFGQGMSRYMYDSDIRIVWPEHVAKLMELRGSVGQKNFNVSIKPTKMKLFSDNNNAFNFCLKKSGNAVDIFHPGECCGVKRYSIMQLADITWPTGLKEHVLITHNAPDQSYFGGYPGAVKREYVFEMESMDSKFGEPLMHSQPQTERLPLGTLPETSTTLTK